MTEAMVEAYAYADPQDTFYDTLEFSCSTEEEKVMVVNSSEKLMTLDIFALVNLSERRIRMLDCTY